MRQYRPQTAVAFSFSSFVFYAIKNERGREKGVCEHVCVTKQNSE